MVNKHIATSQAAQEAAIEKDQANRVKRLQRATFAANTIGFDQETLEKNGRDFEDAVNAGIDIYNGNYDAATNRGKEMLWNNVKYAIDN